MVKRSTTTNGLSKTTRLESERSKSPDPITEKIRELQRYDEEDDRISSVNIHVEPGGTVNVTPRDSEPALLKKPKWARIVAPIAGAVIAIGAVAKAIWDAMH